MDCDVANLGALLRSQGRLNEALAIYQEWLERFSSSKALSLNAVNCAIEANTLKQAQVWLQQALEINKEDVTLQHAQTRLLQAQGHDKQALFQLRSLCKNNPDNLDIWLGLGHVQHRLGELQEALYSFQKAYQINPNEPRASANEITIDQELGRYKEAHQIHSKLPQEVQTSSLVRGAYAYLLMGEQRMVEAATEFTQLCELHPEQPLHWLNRCACFRALKHGMKALSVAKKGVSLHPTHDALRHALSQCLAEIGKTNQAIQLLQPELTLKVEISQQQMFNLQFLGEGYELIPSEQLQTMARSWEKKISKTGVGPLWSDRISEPIQGRALRIGYLSPDLCNHPVGRFLLPILENHDRAAVEMIGLSCGPHLDDVQEKLKSHCQQWVDLQHTTDLEAARIISDLQMDVLVELGGYTSASRLGVLCHHPAPVQLSYLGYFAPTYLHCIDGWIGDEILFGGLTTTQRQAHRLVELNNGYMAYQDKDLPEPRRGSSAYFRFGCFNHARKLSTTAVQLFCKVMKAVPKAELVLKSISFVEEAEQLRVQNMFIKAGLGAERLVLLPWVKGRINHLHCYGEIDVALDPMPYGGATTTCEAIGMGVPVISMAGKGMVGRLSASILKHSGCENWIARDKHHYIEIAKLLANEGIRKASKRIKLRQKVFSSDLCNGKRLSSELERVYREARAISAKARSK